QSLVTILRNTISQAHGAVIEDERYLRLFNFASAPRCTAGELWQHIVETIWPASAAQAKPWRSAITTILQQGPLSKRILKALGRDVSRDHQKMIYRELCDCLAQGKLFVV
ncbi:MAG TPA: glutamate--cysteine ligase, partial [Myxococcota bacterium]|nr:glutamate--cysteine ligase [Myxococcota bacterium]